MFDETPKTKTSVKSKKASLNGFSQTASVTKHSVKKTVPDFEKMIPFVDKGEFFNQH